MQPKIMPTPTLRLVMRRLCMIIAFMMLMIAITSSSSSPVPSTIGSLLFHLQQDQAERGKEQYQVQPEIMQEDYGMWDPTPNCEGGNAAPIPH